MNAVEIEAASSELALQPFDAVEFPFMYLAAFGIKDTTLKRLRTGNNNASDVVGGVRQCNNIHMAVCAAAAGKRPSPQPSPRKRGEGANARHGEAT